MISTQSKAKPEANQPGSGILAQPLLGHIQIQAVHLFGINAVRFPALDKVKEFKFPINQEMKLGANYDKKTRSVVALFDITISVKDKEIDMVKIHATYRALYKIQPSFTGDQEEARAIAFVHTYSNAHIWPYWRELLASTCLKLGIPQILAPMLIVGNQRTTGMPTIKEPKKIKQATAKS